MSITSIARGLAGYGHHQARNLAGTCRGEPLVTPPLNSATLDIDDVALARRLLQQSQRWFDSEPTGQFEKAFARWLDIPWAVAFRAGRVALSACLAALELGEGDEVILPGYTCVVVPNACRFAGVKTVYSDIELETFGLDASLIEEKITSRTRAIFLHHLYGLVCRDYERIVQIARQRGLAVIEDCAQSTGARYKGRHVGTLGDVAFFSLEQSKVLTTIQGGIAVTRNEKYARRLKQYQENCPAPSSENINKLLHQVIVNYFCEKDPQRWWRGPLLWRKYRDKLLVSTGPEEQEGIKPADYEGQLPAPLARLGLHQLGKVDRYNRCRRQTARRWDRWCREHGYTPPRVIDNSIPIYLRYPVLVEEEKKRDTRWALEQLGITAGVWFTGCLHPTDRPIVDCPAARQAVQRCINFPGIAP